MGIDTSATVTIMSKDAFYGHYHCSKLPKVKESGELLSTYTVCAIRLANFILPYYGLVHQTEACFTGHLSVE